MAGLHEGNLRSELKEIDMALTTAEEFITQARLNLLNKFPFFGHLALGLMVIEAPHIPTMAVNKHNHLLFNREFVMSLSQEDLMAIVCHEVGHLVQMCINRFPEGGIFEVWNLASDQVINTIIWDAGIEGDTVFKSAIPESIQKICRNKLTEVRYRELLQEMNISGCPACAEMVKSQGQQKGDDSGSGKQEGNEGEGNEGSDGDAGGSERSGEHGGGSCDSHSHGKGGGSSAGNGGLKHTCKNPLQCSTGSMLGQADNEQVSEATQRMIGAYQIAKEKEGKGRGTMPGNLEQMILNLLKPSVNWRDILSRTAKRVFRGSMDWRRQSKRMVASGIRYPGRKPEMKGAVVTVDTSGSISENELVQFMSEAQGILHSAGCKYMTVFFHDVNCYHMEEYTSKTMNKIKVQRGGTSHVDVFKKIAELKDAPSMIVCFTDLETEFPEQPNKIPVIWAHMGPCSITPPFGKKIEIKLGNLG